MPQTEPQEMAEALFGVVKGNKELLASAALSAAGAVAAAKGPQLVRRLTQTAEERVEGEAERLGEKAIEGAKERVGGGGFAGKILSKALAGGGGKGGGGSGGKKTRRLPIQRWTDVSVPVDKAYDAWLEFDQYPKFMHRVLSVEKKGRDRVRWQEKIWFSRREWEGRITEQRKNDRIVWKTTSGMSHRGIVSFHEIGPHLTRVLVTMEFEPNGMIEKMASGLRFVKRAVQADLARFKAYVEMRDAKGIEYRGEAQQSDGRASRGDSRRSNNGNGNGEGDARRRERQRHREQRRRAAA